MRMEAHTISRRDAMFDSPGLNNSAPYMDIQTPARLIPVPKLTENSQNGYVDMRDIVLSNKDVSYAIPLKSNKALQPGAETLTENDVGDDVDLNMNNWVKYSCSSKTVTDYRTGRESQRVEADRVQHSDTESVATSVYDQARYSQSLKEFENIVKTCTDQGEYVFLSEMNGSSVKQVPKNSKAHLINECLLPKPVNGDLHKDVEGLYSKVNKVKKDVLEHGGEHNHIENVANVVELNDSEITHVRNDSETTSNMKDVTDAVTYPTLADNVNVMTTSDREGLYDRDAVADVDGDLKRIIQECLWYFHSQVEDHRSNHQDSTKSHTRTNNSRVQSSQGGPYDGRRSQNRKAGRSSVNVDGFPIDQSRRPRSQNDVQRRLHGNSYDGNHRKPSTKVDRKYRPSSGHMTSGRGHRPHSMTDPVERPLCTDPRRPRSLTESELGRYDPQQGHADVRTTGEDYFITGDGMSMAVDVSSVSSRNGTQPSTARLHNLPPRVPVNIPATPSDECSEKRGDSLRRRPIITRRSQSAFGMLVSSTEPQRNSPRQSNHVSTGRMFIEDVLNDISDKNGTDNGGVMTSRDSGIVIQRDYDNNEIKVTENIGTAHAPAMSINRSPEGLNGELSVFHTNGDHRHRISNAFRHQKSLSGDGNPSRTLPNFTKNSKFIRSLSDKGIISERKGVSDKSYGSVVTPESPVKNTNNNSLTNGLSVFDIVGEDSGCLYPWQRDASTQYEHIPLQDEAISSSGLVNNKTGNYSDVAKDVSRNKAYGLVDAITGNHSDVSRDIGAYAPQGIQTVNDTVVKRQKVFRAVRPHSVGGMETIPFDAELESIHALQNAAKARHSEPHLYGTVPRRWSSLGPSDEMEASSNLESILESSSEMTLKNGAHRNVLSSPSVSPEIFRSLPEQEAGKTYLDNSDEAVFDSPVGKRRKPTRHRSSGSITSGSEESDHEPSQPLARRGRRSAIVDTKNCGDVSPTTLSPEESPCNSSDEGDHASGQSGRRLSSGTTPTLNVYPGDILVQEHHKKLIKRNTIADFYSGRNGSTPNLAEDNKKQRPFSLLKLMKTRSKESLAQLSDVLQTLKPTEFKDNNLAAYKNVHWTDLIASTDRQGYNGDLHNISPMERKRRESVWELFKSECVFLIDHLMVLKNCFLEPLKKLQVEGFLMYTEPSEIFSNLEDLCYVSYTFCKDFIGSLVKDMSATDFGRTSVLIKALKRFSAHSKDGSVYHTYCLNYSNALTYLEKLRKSDDFCEFEKWCEQDPRCNRLQLADLLIGPMQHCTKLPLLLHNIKKYTEDPLEKRQVAESIDKVEMSLEQLEDKMKWLKNFERVQEIQRQLVWPTVSDLDPRAFIPDNLKARLMRQPCARLLACPTRQLLHEGVITLTETTKTIDAYMFLFDDILLVTKMKKRKKQTSGENMNAPLNDTYTVHRQPLALDRLGIHDLTNQEAAASGMKFAFVIVQISRFQQIIDVFTLQSPTELIKSSWLSKIKKAKSQYHSLSRASSGKEDANSNSISGRTYHGKSKSIDSELL